MVGVGGRRARLWAGVAAVALVAGACGSGDEGSSATEEETEESGGVTEITVEASGDPAPGGLLTYGVEAETDGWNPTSSRWAISGHLVGNAVFDPLAAYDEEGVAKPYLAEEFEVDESGTKWTIHLRDGVTFHDGTPCDAEAVAASIEANRVSPLSQSVLAPVESVTATGPLTVEVVTSVPWFTFPASLTSQVGYVVAPAQLNAEGAESVRQPIGTGPFVFDSWEPDVELRVERNDDYWREGLPYLDSVVFQPIVDTDSRVSALLAGDVNVIHSSNADSIVDLQVEAQSGKIQLIRPGGEKEEVFVMLNHGRPPFDDVDVRRAAALAVDREAFLEAFGAGLVEPASGPFVEDSPWYAEVEVPARDVEEATRLVEEAEAERGAPLEVVLVSGPSAQARQQAQQITADLEAVGFTVDLQSVEQAQQIATVVGGQYDLTMWRQFAAPDPDADYQWWHSGDPEAGGINLNLARIEDPVLDEALEAGRSTTDRAEREEAYATVQEQMVSEAHYIFLNHTEWAIAALPMVRDLANQTLPDGSAALPFGNQVAGMHRLTETWIES